MARRKKENACEGKRESKMESREVMQRQNR